MKYIICNRNNIYSEQQNYSYPMKSHLTSLYITNDHKIGQKLIDEVKVYNANGKLVQKILRVKN